MRNVIYSCALALFTATAVQALPPRNEFDQLRHQRDLRRAYARKDTPKVKLLKRELKRDRNLPVRDGNDNFPYGSAFYGSAANRNGYHSLSRGQIRP